MNTPRFHGEAIVLVHPRRQLDDAIRSAERSGVGLIIVSRVEEADLWRVGDPGAVAGVEIWSGGPEDAAFADFLVEVIERHGARGILGVHEASLLAVNEAAARCGLTGLDSAVIARLRDKGASRKTLAENGLPVPGFVSGPADEDLLRAARDLRLPLVVKPSSGFSSAGVQRVDRYDDLASASQCAVAAMLEVGVPTREVVIEEYIEGPEYAVESISFRGRTHVLTVGYKGNPEGPYFEESIYQVPSGLTEDQEDEVRLTVERAHRALDVENGPTHTELRLGSNGLPYILEVGARVGGSGVSHSIVESATGVDFFAESFAAALGCRPDSLEGAAPGYANAAGNYIVPCRGSGVIREIRGLEELRAHPAVTSVVQMMHPGDVVRPYPDFSGYPAFILSAHATFEELTGFHALLDREIEVVYE